MFVITECLSDKPEGKNLERVDFLNKLLCPNKG